MCSIDSGLWCWDATTQAASDDAPSQRRGWRGVLSFSFKVRMRQGRVTLPCKCLRGVRAPNRRHCLRRLVPESTDRHRFPLIQAAQCLLNEPMRPLCLLGPSRIPFSGWWHPPPCCGQSQHTQPTVRPSMLLLTPGERVFDC